MNLVPPFPVILAVTVIWLILPSVRSGSNTTGAIEDEETKGTTTTTDWSTVTQQQPVVTPKMEIIDSPDDIRPIVPSDGSEHVRSSVVFFSASLSIFAAIGIILFFRKCVTCPSPRNHHHRHHTFEAVEPHPPPAHQLVNLMPILTTPDSPVPVATPIQEELLYLRVGSDGES